jgi:hypothetical protein
MDTNHLKSPIVLFCRISFALFLFFHPLHLKAQSTPVLPDSILSKTATPILSDSIKLSQPTSRNSYFAIGRGGSYGGIGLKVGRYKIKNNRLQAGYIIGGLGAYTNATETDYGLGILACYGRKYYFPDVFYLDGRAGIQEYAYRSGSFLPVPGVKLIAGFEGRGRRMGFSIGAGISQNLLFDYTTRPVIELGFIFGNFKLLKIKPEDYE